MRDRRRRKKKKAKVVPEAKPIVPEVSDATAEAENASLIPLVDVKAESDPEIEIVFERIDGSRPDSPGQILENRCRLNSTMNNNRHPSDESYMKLMKLDQMFLEKCALT